MRSYDECLIWIEEMDPPNVRLTWSVFPWQNSTHVRRRAERLVHKYARGWHCQRCGELMPVWKRTDALYCDERCRKKSARERREDRQILAQCGGQANGRENDWL